MYKNKRILGLIPARGGSKGLPGKNILPLLGYPVIAWTIKEAVKSRYLDNIIVSTDNKKIANVARDYGAETPFMRPKYLATDSAKSIDVIYHALQFLEKTGRKYDYLALLEPTSPLRKSSDIDKAVKILLDKAPRAVSIVGVSKIINAHPVFSACINQKGFLRPYERNCRKAVRRQDITPLYFYEGTIYISSIEGLKKYGGFFHHKTIPYVVPRWKSLELDDMLDFVCIEAILRNKKKIMKEG